MQRGLEHALDEYLVLLAQGGRRDAFARLVERWTPRLLAFAARSTGNTEAAKDAVQDTWESALRAIGRLEDPARFPAWIFSIAARKCADVLRAKYKGQRIAAAAADPGASQETDAPDGETQLDLASALARLPAEQRVAVALLYGEDMSVAEIAAITGAPAGTVKSRLSAARHALRAFMEGKDNE